MSDDNDNVVPTTTDEGAEGVTPSASSQENSDVSAPSSEVQADAKETPDAGDTSTPAVAKKEPETLLSKVTEAMDKKAAQKVAKDPTNSQDEKKDGQQPEGKKPDGKEGEADIPKEFHKHPAWQRLKSERDTARKEVEGFKRDAESYRKMDAYMKANQIPGKEAANALRLTALSRSNPREFVQEVTKMLQDIQVHIGEVLPADLQKDVDDGMITAERAKELSLARVQNAAHQRQLEQSSERIAESDSEAELTHRATIFDGWARGKQNTDPDLLKKLPLLQGELLKLNQQKGYPQSDQEVVDRLEMAHKTVTETMRGFIPQRKPVAASPRGGAAGSQASEPKNMADIVGGILNKRRE